jgi:hypothetical protein
VEHLKVLPEPVFKPALTEDDQMRLWPVEEILDHRKRKVEGVTQSRNEYLIRWAGFGAESDSWEPVTAIADGSLIIQYHAAQANSRLRTRQAQGIRRYSPFRRECTERGRSVAVSLLTGQGRSVGSRRCWQTHGRDSTSTRC